MKFRVLSGVLATAAVLITGTAVPASATERANVSQQECNDRHDFTEFFRNFDNADKYCYSRAGATSVLPINLDHVTWIHAGANSGEVKFIDGATGLPNSWRFSQLQDTGCTNCFITSLRLDSF